MRILKRESRRRVNQGDYPSADELVSEAVRRFLAEDEEDIEELRAMLAKADEQIERGDYTEYNAETIHLLAERIKADGRAKGIERKETSRG